MTPAQLARAVAGLTPPLARALLAALEDWQLRASRMALARLERAVASGDVQLVVRLVLGDAIADAVVVTAPPFPDAGIAYPRSVVLSPAAIAAVTRAEAALLARAEASVRLAYRLGEGVLPPRPPAQTAVGADFPEPVPPRPVVLFRAGLPDAAAGATRYAGEALSYLRSEAHAGVRAAVEAGLQAGVNPRDIARQLRDVVGLGASQARWVANLRTELEAGRYEQALGRQLLNGPIRRTVEAAARANRPLTAQQLDRVVEGYAGKWRAWHAETIARTMALDLARHGQDAAMRAAIARGDYAGLVVFKTWITTVDGRERDAHRALNGRRIRFEATWNDAGVARRVPGGWNCRCSVRMQAVPEATALGAGDADLPGDATPGGRQMVNGQGGTGGADSPVMWNIASGAGGGGRGNGGGRAGRGAGGAGWSDDEIRALERDPQAGPIIREYVASDDFAAWLQGLDDTYVPVAHVSPQFARDVGSTARVLRLSRREILSHTAEGRNNDHPEMRDPETYRVHLPTILDDYRITDRRGRRVALLGGAPRYTLVVRPTVDELRLFLVTLFRTSRK